MPDVVAKAPQITTEEYKQYSGKDVAIYKGKIIASGKNSVEAFKNAKKKCPEAKSEEIIIEYIESADTLIL